jgi:hypothetical protein
VQPLEPEPVKNRAQLLEERLDRPERRVVGPRGVAAPELVVEDDPPTLSREGAEPFERSVRAAGPAVQAEQRQPPGGLAVADEAVGGLPAAER